MQWPFVGNKFGMTSSIGMGSLSNKSVNNLTQENQVVCKHYDVMFCVSKNMIPLSNKFPYNNQIYLQDSTPEMRRTNQQPSMPMWMAVLECCLLSFHFLSYLSEFLVQNGQDYSYSWNLDVPYIMRLSLERVKCGHELDNSPFSSLSKQQVTSLACPHCQAAQQQNKK